MHMADLVTAGTVIPRLCASGRRHALRELGRIAAKFASLDPDRVLAALPAGEGSTSFGLEWGVAIPHAMVDGLCAPVGVFARLELPVDFGAAGGEPADLVFLLLGPAGEGGTMLRALSCVARRLRDREVRARLRSAGSAEALYAVLVSDIWRGTVPPRLQGPPEAPTPGRGSRRALESS
jgi:PTS system nitrogen regulatory IIA component